MDSISKQLMEENKNLTESLLLKDKISNRIESLIDENKDLKIFLGILRAQLFDANTKETVLTNSIDNKLKQYEKQAK